MEILVVLCTFPSLDSARRIGTALVEAGLAACVNLCPEVESIYRWQGKMETAGEVLALIKTTSAEFEALGRKVREMHPYEVPEIIALRADQVSADYARWIHDSVGGC